jgi:hypothetical protein
MGAMGKDKELLVVAIEGAAALQPLMVGRIERTEQKERKMRSSRRVKLGIARMIKREVYSRSGLTKTKIKILLLMFTIVFGFVAEGFPDTIIITDDFTGQDGNLPNPSLWDPWVSFDMNNVTIEIQNRALRTYLTADEWRETFFDNFSLITVSAGDVVINEVAWMGTQASASDEWIELYNSTSQDIDLTGWTLESITDGTPSFTFDATNCSHLIIPAQGYFLLERTDDNAISDIAADCIYTGSLVNSGESLALKDPFGTVIDTANGDHGPWPAGVKPSDDPVNWGTMERIDPVAPDSDANWVTNDDVRRNGLDVSGNPINGTPKALNSTVNNPPVADAGADQTVSVGDPVQLDGTGSFDPDGDPLTFSWAFVSKPSGSQAKLSSATSTTLTLTPDLEGGYVLELAVSDGRSGTDSDQVAVTAISRDLNRDGKVNTIDARICLRVALGFLTLSNENHQRCDVGNDGQVEEADARKIARYSLGLIGRLARSGGLAASGLLVLELTLTGLVGLLPAAARCFRSRDRKAFRTARAAALGGLGVALSISLAGCLGVPVGLFLPHQPSRLLADIGPTIITIHVQNMPSGGLAALEARAGGFAFNPAVIEVKAIQPGAGWQLLASKIDNAKGEVRFAVVNPAGGTVTGQVLVLTIQRKQSEDAGLRWDKAKLTLGDANDREIASYQTEP